MRQGAGGFRELDVVADQQTNSHPVPQAGGEAITGFIHATLRRPQVRLAILEGDTLGGNQQRSVVEPAVVALAGADDHGNVAITGGCDNRTDGRALQRFGNLGHGLRAREAHQVAFREHDQLRIGSAGVDRRQGTFEVVSRVIVTACQLREFDFHGESLF
ncbi:hypothetical protein D3C76_1147700 [compost metagenome]